MGSLLRLYYGKKVFDNLSGSVTDLQERLLKEIASEAGKRRPYPEESLEIISSTDELSHSLTDFPVLTQYRLLRWLGEPPKDSEITQYQTSGYSSGRMKIPYNEKSVDWRSAIHLRTLLNQGYSITRQIGQYGDNIGEKSLIGELLMPTELIHCDLSPEEQLEKLEEEDYDFIYYLSVELFTLAKFSRKSDKNWDINPEKIFTHGEVLTEGMRNLIENEFNTEVLDHYAMAETGIIAWECPETDKYHVAEDNVFTELVDENNKPLESGTGRLLVTNLTNIETPVLRYDTGNIIKKTEDVCDCDIPFKTIDSILGRYETSFVNSAGKIVTPNLILEIMSSFESVLSFQLRVKQDSYVMVYNPLQEFDEKDHGRLKDALQNHGIRPVKFKESLNIERSEGGKHRVILIDEEVASVERQEHKNFQELNL